MAARSPTEPEDASGPPPATQTVSPPSAPPASPSVTTALKHAPMGIAIFDDQMRYLAASSQYLTDQNMPADTPLLGRRHYDVFPEIPQFWRDKLARVLAEGVELREDEGDRYVDRNGDVHWVRWSMAPWRTDDGRIGGLVLYTEMVTQAVEAKHRLQAAEARYRAVFDQAAMGVARVSGSGLPTLFRLDSPNSSTSSGVHAHNEPANSVAP